MADDREIKRCITEGDRISLERHLNMRIDSLKELVQAEIDSVKESITVAKSAQDLRLEGMNEFREQLNQQTKTFISRAEYDTKYQVVDEKINKIDHRMASVELMRAEITGRVYSLGVIGAVLIVVIEFIMHYVLEAHCP